MEAFIQVIFVLLSLVSFVGWVLLGIAGFRVGVWWGLGNLFLTIFVGPFFAMRYWDQARMGCLLQLIPTLIMIVVGIVAGGIVAGMMGSAVMEEMGESTLQMEQEETSPSFGGDDGDSTSSGTSSSTLSSGGSIGGGASGSEVRSEPSTANRVAPPKARYEYRDYRFEELASAIGKAVKIDMNDGRKRTGTVKSYDDDTVRIEQRVRGGTMEFPVRRSEVARVMVRERLE